MAFLGRTLPVYGLFACLGALAAVLYIAITQRSGRLGRVPPPHSLHIPIVAALGAVAGGKLLYALTMLPTLFSHWPAIKAAPFSVFSFLFGGMVFYGGLFGAVGAVALYSRKAKLASRTVMALYTPVLPLFHTFGRLGCLFAGCCWGKPAHWGVTYTHSAGAPNGIPLIPVQGIEACFELLLFFLCAVWVRRAKNSWQAFSLYIYTYALFRFFIELWRGDMVRGIWFLSTSQWISLILLATLPPFLYMQKQIAR